jgi:hypothetical protein
MLLVIEPYAADGTNLAGGQGRQDPVDNLGRPRALARIQHGRSGKDVDGDLGSLAEGGANVEVIPEGLADEDLGVV